MSSDVWERPLEVTTDHGDHLKSIRDCRDAIAYMMTNWPNEKLALYSLARKACLRAIDGRATAVDAASAFSVAAKDAGTL